MSRWIIMAWAVGLVLVGCDDEAGGGADPSADTGPAPDAAVADMAAADGAPLPDAAPPSAPEPAFVELSIAPRRAVYGLEDRPQVTAVVYDRVGGALADVELMWRVVEPVPRPDPIATLDEERRLTFLREGPGAVRACYRGMGATEICGRVSFFVDAGAPLLALDSPARGAFVEVPEIPVAGRTTPSARVFVNDVEVDVGADGAFATTLPAVFGLNRVDVVADDGVRRPAPRAVREVVYAPRLVQPGPAGVSLEEVLAVRVGQALLDTGVAPPAPDEAGVVRLEDLAGVIEAFVARVEPLVVIEERVLADEAAIRLELVDAGPGVPDVTLRFTDTGLEVFLRLEDMEVRTAGRVDIEGVAVDLGGAVRVTASAFALIAIEAGPGGAPRLRLEDVGVAIERIGGEMVDSTAQAVLDTVGSIIRSLLQGFAVDYVDALVSEAVPEFIELGLEDALASLAHIPVDMAASELLPAIAFDLGFTLEAPRAQARSGLTLTLNGEIGQRGPVQAPHPFPGIPAEAEGSPPWPAAGGLSMAVQLVTINALVFELWRQGALQLDLAGVIPEQFQALLAGGRLDARLPPLVVGTPPGSPWLLEVQLGELDLELLRPGQDQPDRYALSLRAAVGVEVHAGGIRLLFDEAFDLRAELIEASSPAPFSGEALAAIIRPLLLQEVRAGLADGLDLPVEPVIIGPDAYAAFAPGIASLRLAPDFPEAPFVRGGWLMIPVGFAMELTEAR